MKPTALLIAIFSAFILSCRDAGVNTPATDSSSLDISEAVFRYLFDDNESGMQQHAPVYFLSTYRFDSPGSGYENVSPTLIVRFSGSTPQVKNFSDSEFRNYFGGVYDKQTGQQGLLFWIQSVTQTAENEVEVDCGYYEANLSAAGHTLTLRRTANATWTVIRDRMNWIS